MPAPSKCPSCGARAHDFAQEEALRCVPPRGTRRFGPHLLGRAYRAALFRAHPAYTAEEVVGSFLGHNRAFPSQRDWEDSLRRGY